MVYIHNDSHQESETKGQTAALFVSLYLVVLAFFILLNSISHIEVSKKTTAIGSVKDTFSIHPVDTQPKLKPVNQSGRDLPLSQYYTPIEKLAKSMIELVDSKLIDDGKKLQITLASDTIFFPYSESLKSDAEAFLVRLATLLSSADFGKRIDIETVFSVKLGFEETFGEQLSVNRAEQLRTMLSSLGVDKRNLFFGVSTHGNEQLFDLRFLVRDANDTTIIERATPAISVPLETIEQNQEATIEPDA